MSADDISPTKILWAVLGLVLTIVLALGGWLCSRSIAHDAQITAVQYQLQALIQTQTNVIPPVIEAALMELRSKGNSDRELNLKAVEIATGNQKDIGYIKEQLATFREQIRAKIP